VSDRLVKDVLEAVVSSIDRERLSRALDGVVPKANEAPSGSNKTASAVVNRIVLSDILDDAILGARPGDPSFPLRVFFGTLGDSLADDTAFALASGLNFYFRVTMDEDAKMRLGVEASRLYYEFAAKNVAKDVATPLAPLLARLMSTELERVRFEHVDAGAMFDSSIHERVPGSDASGARVRAPKSFLCRVVSTSMVRSKALVST
jgi:hypothetical protein